MKAALQLNLPQRRIGVAGVIGLKPGKPQTDAQELLTHRAMGRTNELAKRGGMSAHLSDSARVIGLDVLDGELLDLLRRQSLDVGQPALRGKAKPCDAGKAQTEDGDDCGVR